MSNDDPAPIHPRRDAGGCGTTAEAVKLLECIARQERWTFGCFDLPGAWNWSARWLASESLSVRFENPNDWRAVYVLAAAHLRFAVQARRCS